jgi:hypothetical protein
MKIGAGQLLDRRIEIDHTTFRREIEECRGFQSHGGQLGVPR